MRRKKVLLFMYKLVSKYGMYQFSVGFMKGEDLCFKH